MAKHTISVVEHGSVAASWYYTVDVEADTREEAEELAVELARLGQVDPYDMKTGDALDGDGDDFQVRS